MPKRNTFYMSGFERILQINLLTLNRKCNFFVVYFQFFDLCGFKTFRKAQRNKDLSTVIFLNKNKIKTKFHLNLLCLTSVQQDGHSISKWTTICLLL